MSFKSRLDDLEDLAAHGLLSFWEAPELWVRRRPFFYIGLGLAVVAVALL